MADRSSGARYLPSLAFLLIVLIAGAVARLYLSAADVSSGSGRPAIESLMHTQSARLQAAIALDGSQEAFDTLAATRLSLDSIDIEGLSVAQRRRLQLVQSSVDELLEGREDVQALYAAVQRMSGLLREFTDAVQALESDTSSQPQPALHAHLGRLRLLAASLLSNARALASGVSEPADVSRSMVDAEMELSQGIRVLQNGDPALGINAIPGSTAGEAIVRLAELAAAMRESVQNVLAVSDRLIAIRQASRQLDAAAFRPEIGALLAGVPAGTVEPSMPPVVEWLTRPLTLLTMALLVFLIMAWIYHGAADSRKATAVLAERTERDQEAILKLLDELGSLADGDLTVRATVGADVTGAIADSVNYAIEALRDLVTTISDTAIQVDSATKRTEVSAHKLAAASDGQSRQVKAASHSIAHMAASVDEVSGNAERSSDVARHSVDVAHKGGDAVRRTIEGMNTIRETIQDTSKRIKRLGESSQEIGHIVELINDIAEQTNILALNASIHASMAGEAGRGFAVVADEVQRLAERSANATKRIEVLVRTIQSDTNEAVVSMERSTTDVVGGALLAENAGAALEEIEQVSNQIAMLVQNISESAKEQTNVAKGILENMSQLEEISTEADQITSATTDSISQLSRLASQLRKSIAGFHLPDSVASSMVLDSVELDDQDEELENEGTQTLVAQKTA